MPIVNMTDIHLAGKRVLIREDWNVPIKDGVVTSDARLRASLPTLALAQQAGASVMVMSHLGRPKEGQYDASFSLQPVVNWLTAHLPCKVRLQRNWLAGVEAQPGELIVLENCRFNAGETANDEGLSKQLAALCDVYVNDAFGTAHRVQASTHGVAKFAPVACAGPLLAAELKALGKALDNPKRPVVAIVGGAKVSSKLKILSALSAKVDQLIVGGGIANTFLAAAGYPVGKSLFEADLVDYAKNLMTKTSIPIPTDVVTATQFSVLAEATTKAVADVTNNDIIMDLGLNSAATIAAILQQAGTIIWNGPLGVFEFDQFGHGTKTLSDAIATANAFSIAGGGDTLAAVEKYDVAQQISYISTGGGAFLAFMEGKPLPALAILEQREN